METGATSTTFEALQAENLLLREKASLLEQQLAQMAFELAQLKRLVFGFKSERFVPSVHPEQLPLFGGGPATADAEPEKITRTTAVTKPKQKPVRQLLPSHLPREVVVIEPEVDKAGLVRIGEEVTETLDYRPARLVVIRRERPQYVDPRDESRGVIIAELPPRPIDKGIAEPGLLAHVLISKYVDHLPYYRQIQQFKREGITLSDSTIGGWGSATMELLEPLYERMAELVRSSGYIQADETPIRVLDREKKQKTHRGFYWVYLAPTQGLVCVEYQSGRGREGPTGWLSGYRGALQSDGYIVYKPYDNTPGVKTYSCWAHVRRNFFEAKDSAPRLAEEALRRIKELYEIEQKLREAGADAEMRRLVRRKKAVPLLESLEQWLKENPGLPQSPWGKAVTYAQKRWAKLVRYTEDGQIEIGRVGRWRGGLGRRSCSLFAAWFPGGATISRPCSVSTSRSSNRTCRFPASGSHLRPLAFAFGRSARLLGSLMRPSLS